MISLAVLLAAAVPACFAEDRPAPALPAAAAGLSAPLDAGRLGGLFDGSAAKGDADAVPAGGVPEVQGSPIPKDDPALLEDLSKRAFLFFQEQSDPKTGLVADRAAASGAAPAGRMVASMAATGFGLSAYCSAAERGWAPREALVARTKATLRFLARESPHKNGWFYHFIHADDGSRAWDSEVSSIDTALLLGGVLTVRQCFGDDPEVAALASEIYERVDFPWMLDGDKAQFSHGWTPEKGFIRYRWDTYAEESLLLVLGMGSRTHPVGREVWDGIRRDRMSYAGHDYIAGASPLFTHQFSQAWLDLRGMRDGHGIDYYRNSVEATRAHKQYCLDLGKQFPAYSGDVWGLSASDSEHGYRAWGGPPAGPDMDGTVVPNAAGGSLMFTPDISIPAIRAMREKYGDKTYGRYGFVDAFNPQTGWVDPDVLGIDQGIMLLSAENLRSGGVWKWFMKNPEVAAALAKAGFKPSGRESSTGIPGSSR
ncbi:MAG: glucoamylase family protein [Elusimicrobiota bacterium]|jgi:hypothetical protein